VLEFSSYFGERGQHFGVDGELPRDDQRPRIYLLDSRDDELYRPLVSATGRARCVCTPLSQTQRRLRIGHTTLLQVAFPALPAATSAIDVAIATVPTFGQVPLTRAGRIPIPAQPTELARPGAPAPESGFSSDMFRYGPGEQIFRIQPNRVLASTSFTTLEWTIRSVTGGAGLEAASSAPFDEPDAAGVEPADPVTASGPVLVVETVQGTRTLRARMVRLDESDAWVRECLCSPLRGWTSVLSRPDKAVIVVTTYPPLPAGTDRVQVRFRGVGTMSVPVAPAPNARNRISETRAYSQQTWRPADARPGPGWTSEDWPTPVPSADQLPDR